MRVQSVDCMPNYGKIKCVNPNFKGKRGAILGGIGGSALLTAAFVTTIAVTGPVGWAIGAWVAAASAVGGAVAGDSFEEKIKERFKKDKTKGSSLDTKA